VRWHEKGSERRASYESENILTRRGRVRVCGQHPQVPWKADLITLPGDEAKADFSLAQLRGLGLEVEVVHGINSTQARLPRAAGGVGLG